MKYNNILKTIISTIFIIGMAGCTPVTLNQIKTVVNTTLQLPEDKEIVYTRDEVSQELTDRVYSIIQAMSANDLTLINNSFIKKDFGFYNMFKIEGSEIFMHQEMIYNILEEEVEEVSHLISRVEKNAVELNILHKDVKFNCSPNDDALYGWNGDGLYIKNFVEPILSKIMKETNIYQKDKYSKKDLLKAKLIEKTSYKIILTPELSFTLTKLDNLWYITSIDRITTDCSSTKE